MNKPVDVTTCLVIGPKGSGKSFIVKRGLAKVARWVAWDLKGEYASVPGARLWKDLRDFARMLEQGGKVKREVFACNRSQFDAWCTWVYQTGNILAVIEEIGRHCTAGSAPGPLQDLFDRSRHSAVDLIAIGPRIAQIPKALGHQADELLVFRSTMPNDLQYLGEWLGPRAAERIRDLQDHHFLRLHT